MKPKLKVTIRGTGINDEYQVLSHEMLPYPAGTYHKLTLVTGTILYVNDFGVRQVWVEKL